MSTGDLPGHKGIIVTAHRARGAEDERMNNIVKIWRLIRLILHLLLGMLITPLALTRRDSTGLHTNPYVTSWWHSRVADILGLRITVSGPRPKAPALLASNHVSWLDIVVLGGLTHTDFLSKYEVRKWPVMGWLAARSGTLFIRRGQNETAVVRGQMKDRLRHRGMLTLFPEGTTTDGREVRPFFSRLFAAAIDTGTDVTPVALRYHIDGDHDPLAPYTDDQSILDNLRGLIARDHTGVNVVFGDRIRLDGHSRKQIADLAREEIVAALRGPEQIPLHSRLEGGAASARR